MSALEVWVERGSKRTFAGAIEWPGLARAARDEAAALDALVATAPRYERALARRPIAFAAPASVAGLFVAERAAGNATTDFGAPDCVLRSDGKAMSPAEVKRAQRILEACWAELDALARSAKGRKLRLGPRGGGRSLEDIVAHVAAAQDGYLKRLGWEGSKPSVAQREAIIEGIAASARGEIAPKGPRGGARWKPRRFMRRAAWHILDHAWEIEERMP